jgi:hypothetical protein
MTKHGPYRCTFMELVRRDEHMDGHTYEPQRGGIVGIFTHCFMGYVCDQMSIGQRNEI